MARENINTGGSANDGTGDSLRTAGVKINNNFTELYGLLGGDAGGAGTTRLTDSGLDIIGTSFNTKIGAVDPASEIDIDFPDSSGTVLVTTATQTVTNKTISADDNTISGIAASSFVLSNASGNIDGSASQKAIPTGAVIGTTDTQTLSNKALIRPKIEQWLGDSSGLPVISFNQQESTTNRIKVDNATSGSPPIISAVGSSDTNIHLYVDAKGTGSTKANKVAYGTPANLTTNNTANISQYGNIVLNAGSLTVTVPNGTINGEVKIFTNINASNATVDPTSFNQGNDITLAQYETVTLVWHNSSWFVTGGYGYTVNT